MSDYQYSEEEFAEIAARNPFGDLSYMDVGLVHLRWVWANRIRQHFIAALGREDQPAFTETGEPRLEADEWMFMYFWYGLLWAALEASRDRGIVFAGRLGQDFDQLSDRLRMTRNAVFHIPKTGEGEGFTRGGYHDERLTRLMRGEGDDWAPDPTTVPAIYRVHSGLGRLLLEEMRRRIADASA
jgi:hypothetical protein